jgi:hypothetical protein
MLEDFFQSSSGNEAEGEFRIDAPEGWEDIAAAGPRAGNLDSNKVPHNHDMELGYCIMDISYNWLQELKVITNFENIMKGAVFIENYKRLQQQLSIDDSLLSQFLIPDTLNVEQRKVHDLIISH